MRLHPFKALLSDTVELDMLRLKDRHCCTHIQLRLYVLSFQGVSSGPQCNTVMGCRHMRQWMPNMYMYISAIGLYPMAVSCSRWSSKRISDPMVPDGGLVLGTVAWKQLQTADLPILFSRL